MAEVSDNVLLTERRNIFYQKICEIKASSKCFTLLSKDEIQTKIEEIEQLKMKTSRSKT